MKAIEPATEHAARAFLDRVARQYDVTGAILFGSRARGDYRADSRKPVWGVYGAFIASCIGYVWSSGKGNIAGETALMLIFVILTFSWVIQRMYWTYAHRIYAAITELNNEVRKREQHIYDHFLKNGQQADYGRFRVYPELNVIFSIVGVALMFASIFTVAASVEFSSSPIRPPTSRQALPSWVSSRCSWSACGWSCCSSSSC